MSSKTSQVNCITVKTVLDFVVFIPSSGRYERFLAVYSAGPEAYMGSDGCLLIRVSVRRRLVKTFSSLNLVKFFFFYSSHRLHYILGRGDILSSNLSSTSMAHCMPRTEHRTYGAAAAAGP